jgi:sortase A
MFRDLDQMEIKDVFFLHAAQETLAYEVESVRVVLPTDISALEIEEGRDLVTLITCDPYMINSHRMLVRAHRTEYNEGVKAKSQDRKISPLVKYQEYLFVIVFFAILILFIKFIQTRVKKRTYEENWK